MIKLYRTALLAAGLMAGSIGFAQTPVDGAPRIAVAYGDLDLSSDAGTRVLYNRIKSAANAVCPYANAQDLKQISIHRTCREAAINRAVGEVNNPQLVALRAEHVKHG
jgi:UrcA family protein